MRKLFIVWVLALMSVSVFSYTNEELNQKFQKNIKTNHVIEKFTENALYDKTDNVFYAKEISEDKIKYFRQGNYPAGMYANSIMDYLTDFKENLKNKNQTEILDFFVNNMINKTKISYINNETKKFSLTVEDIKGCFFELENAYSLSDADLMLRFAEYSNNKNPDDILMCYGYLKMDLSDLVGKFAQDFYNKETQIINSYKNTIESKNTAFGKLDILAPKDAVKYSVLKKGEQYKDNKKYYDEYEVHIGSDNKLYNKNGIITGVVIDTSEFKENFDYCVYPRIRIPNGDIVYSSVIYLQENVKSYASYIDNKDNETIKNRLGENPIVIKAYGIAGINGAMSDIVLSENDAGLYMNYMEHMEIMAKYDMLKHANYITDRYNSIPRFIFAENNYKKTLCGYEKTTLGMFILQKMGIVKSNING